MSTDILTRGTKITFRTTFFDIDGIATNPGSATIHIRYPFGKQILAATPIALSQAGDIWTGTWESNVSDAGKVAWSMRSSGPTIVSDGFITLTANPANPAA